MRGVSRFVGAGSRPLINQLTNVSVLRTSGGEGTSRPGSQFFTQKVRTWHCESGHRYHGVRIESVIENIDLQSLSCTNGRQALRKELSERGALAVIRSTQARKMRIPHDAEMYNWYHQPRTAFSVRKNGGASP